MRLPGIDWKDYPRLASWFEARPEVNMYSIELAKLVDDVREANMVEWKQRALTAEAEAIEAHRLAEFAALNYRRVVAELQEERALLKSLVGKVDPK